jgi:predicted DNA-binding transcriptional regulator YafY
MPKNKEALIRYRVINKCLLDKTYATRLELKEACERALDIYPIGERTIEADINAMRYDDRLGYHAPIGIDRQRSAYFYEDPGYSIDNIPLNEEELDSIVFASKVLEQFKDIEIFRKFSGSVQKLVDAVKVYRLNDDFAKADFIEFEKVEEAKGREFLEPLMDALKNRRVLKIIYRTFSSKKNIVHIVHPCLLKEYRNRWYLVGYHNRFRDIRTYSLDRFVSLEIEFSTTYIDADFDAAKYYEDVVGISVLKKDPVEITIAFTEEQAQYVITQPLHHSQKLLSQENDQAVFRYFLIPNFEFYAQVLGWGDEVEILSPQEIRDEMLKIGKSLVSMYKEQ